MKSIGYAGAQLYRCRYSNVFSIVMCAPDAKTAREAFILFLNDRNYKDVIYTSKVSVKVIKSSVESTYWAQVDMTAV